MGKEQLRQFILEYLSPAGYKGRLQQSANMRSAQTARKTGRDQLKGYLQAGSEIDKATQTRARRVAKVEKGRGNVVLRKPTKLAKKGFDDSTLGSKTRKPSPEGGSRLGVE
tara:strand:+ start:114 stop:446 length:333 start_codon:yes stop_codon:yes gene_type:complete